MTSYDKAKFHQVYKEFFLVILYAIVTRYYLGYILIIKLIKSIIIFQEEENITNY